MSYDSPIARDLERFVQRRTIFLVASGTVMTAIAIAWLAVSR